MKVVETSDDHALGGQVQLDPTVHQGRQCGPPLGIVGR